MNLDHNANVKPMIELEKIELTYSEKKQSVDALCNINLTINEGDFLCVLGPSGCGKSTLLGILAGYLKPTGGTARMNGEPINGANWKRAVVFQTPTLYPWLSAYDNIAFGLKMRHLPKEEIAEKVEKYIKLVGLEGFGDSKPYELSGGMKQRVALARTLVNQPSMILMDEPFGALDAITRSNMQELVRKLWRETGSTILMITHDVDEALTLATRVIVMSQRPGTIVKSFNTAYTYDFSEQGEGVRFSDDYVKIRKEILGIINNG